jgi:hypothetical protein
LVSPWRGKFPKLKNNEFRKDGIDLHQRELITVSAKRIATLKAGDHRNPVTARAISDTR